MACVGCVKCQEFDVSNGLNGFDGRDEPIFFSLGLEVGGKSSEPCNEETP